MPSEYFAENIYTTFQDDWTAFQHADVDELATPDVGERLPALRLDMAVEPGDAAEHTKGLSQTQTDAIVCNNVADLYHLDLVPLT